MLMPVRLTVSTSLFKKLFYIVGLLFFGGIIAFCCFYVGSDHSALTSWYYSLNSCFYGKSTWAIRFFSPATKQQGNALAAAGIAVALLLSAYSIARLRQASKEKRTIEITDLGWYIAVAILALAAGLWSWRLMSPAYDEVFSAVNCAELHPFQTLSYYMLPNNHIYFNFINNILFSWVHKPVGTGRLLSLLAYVGILLSVYHWLRRLTGNNIFSFILLLPVAFQFMTWGLAAQARGYEIQLFCAWLSFITLPGYIAGGKKFLLRINAVCCIAGFAMVSTYLHYFIAQVLLMTIVMVMRRKADITFFRYQAMTIAMVFLLYLPAFCFSGLPAFTANRYVSPMYANWLAFWPDFFNTSKYFINCCFSMLLGEDRAPNFILFFLPLVLLLFKKTEQKIIGVFYVCLWLTYILVTLKMRHIPFSRNLGIQFSLTMAIVAYTFYLLMHKVAAMVSSVTVRRWVLSILFVTPVLTYTMYLATTNKRDVAHNIYYNDVNDIFACHSAEAGWIPPSATIGFSEECFLSYYIFRKDHPNSRRCASGNEEFYIKRRDEPLPPGSIGKYEKWKDGAEDYEFYKRSSTEALLSR
jgi:hypothetical protein